MPRSLEGFPSLASEWDKFRETILVPAGVAPSSTQFVETRRAFYAGAACMFYMTLKVSADDISEDQGELYLAKLEGEINRWVHALKVGAV